ncbi:hypothetical protein LOZ04_002029 [Ophidiomyces ophidiicola]|uniref:Uncharacterized protein n=1 Tax=Ophidiomyces ophidiicola TaxID=1387563 RepID=A0ACB8UXB7_9EURO|nr:hypothetical protein LOZ62_003779 [Ophidiomyces ophidiicola]KAI1972325.1 hypothetical protein LOZ56_002542 [Ophidiomyces ophidiicola]KAI2038410.1 hypothetical protein LOZ47_003183 [Ophidiomyces ophidiicola]KAI2051607.1 hypothetical protein LOZ38_002669 [Ophidiomyces ophidiicola]KAI2056814.1 hypothetical protein LOZ44_001841 [Ophidiomyces ophidiicola]
MAPLQGSAMSYLSLVLALCGAATALPGGLPAGDVATQLAFERMTIVNKTFCGEKEYDYLGMAGYGTLPHDAVDRFGDTIGGIGSGLVIGQGSWTRRENGSYEGVAWASQDRGWNTNGTLNVQARIHQFEVKYTPVFNATPSTPSAPNLQIKYVNTILLKAPDATPITGLDADEIDSIMYPGFPPMPGATVKGNGFGGPGIGGRRISMDLEGIALDSIGTFWVSDEYGPYLYQFSRTGLLIQAVAPPMAYLPRRNGQVSFSAASPPSYDPDRKPQPVAPETGRNNNQGLEGLTICSDYQTMYAMMQSGMNQEGGPSRQHSRQARLLKYKLDGTRPPTYEGEWIVTLPMYTDAEGKQTVAAQSEINCLPTGDVAILTRDGGAGRGQRRTRSVFRHIDILSGFGHATNIKSWNFDKTGGAIASDKGELKFGLKALDYCPWIDINSDDQLARFGLHNGGAQDAQLLSEKWESLVLMPLKKEDWTGQAGPDKKEYLLFTMSDNDFVTQNGRLNNGQFVYQDKSGCNVDTQVLVFRVAM